MNESARRPWDRASRLRQAEWWTATVWGEREGFASWVLGVGGHFERKSYKFDRFAPRFAAWPPSEGLSSFAAGLVAASDEDDVFVAPLLRSTRRRSKANGLPGHFLYADVDDPQSDDQRRLLARLLAKDRSFRVLSGRGSHVYVELESVFDLNTFEDLNHRLADGVGADSKWDASALLRLPGTFSHKNRARAGTSVPVVIDGWQ